MKHWPGFGTPAKIERADRVPGFEGSGIIEALGDCNDPALELPAGQRVAFFPVAGAWSEIVIVPNRSLMALPDDVGEEVGAQMLMSTVMASLVVRAGLEAVSVDLRKNMTVLQIGAASAVGRLIGWLLAERGIPVIRPESMPSTL